MRGWLKIRRVRRAVDLRFGGRENCGSYCISMVLAVVDANVTDAISLLGWRS
jgi:hypothetical protein